ncbi:hypothetical protein [Pseudomonas sp. AN-1]|jgi:hypothetical protein|uniref:hypothetical protein n=1 Tax=Pseudomonas sp. AN-1 TaxID=3096605 RepID=UPI002A6AD54E|nr:hypothetical protein [Pseudomonas sp. AN-1]WPP47250.1 hypothetical protein SK095_07705 [Pseudomonas sp. AN-1]
MILAVLAGVVTGSLLTQVVSRSGGLQRCHTLAGPLGRLVVLGAAADKSAAGCPLVPVSG